MGEGGLNRILGYDPNDKLRLLSSLKKLFEAYSYLWMNSKTYIEVGRFPRTLCS